MPGAPAVQAMAAGDGRGFPVRIIFSACMEIELPLSILPQPDNSSCGPTCLHAVYAYYGDRISLDTVINETRFLVDGGTLAVFLACHALRRGYRASIYTYNLQVFDPTWFLSPDIDISERLTRQAEAKDDPKLRDATRGYLEFLSLGGKLKYTDLTTRLLRSLIRKRLPVLTGLSFTYLYRNMREFGPDSHDDDIRGNPGGHFVVLSGYNRKDRTILIKDPYRRNAAADVSDYHVNIDRVICSILLGVLTYDANLLVIYPG